MGARDAVSIHIVRIVMKSSLAPGIPAAVLALLTCVTSAANAQTTADLFDRDSVQEIRLFINSRDLDRLRVRFREDIYYVADFQWRNIRVRNVAVRSRGSASRSASKPALRVDFNRYTTGQHFLGLKSVILDNLLQHGSFVTESTAMAFFDRMGQPAPRESFCRLYINNVFHGVYALVESVDTDFLTRSLGEDAGYLFSYQHQGAFYGEYLGDELASYKRLFSPQNHELESDGILYSPIRDLFREVNHPEDGVWRDRVEQYLDLRQFVTHVAIESFLAEEDGILGISAMNNFYLYRHANSSRHRLIVWDKDSTFASSEASLMMGAAENVVFRRAMAYPDLLALYLDVLERCAHVAAEESWLEGEITRAAALIAPHVDADMRKPFSTLEFHHAVALLQEFARARSSFVLREVAQIRAAAGRPAVR
jgi:spore coat protein CotH